MPVRSGASVTPDASGVLEVLPSGASPSELVSSLNVVYGPRPRTAPLSTVATVRAPATADDVMVAKRTSTDLGSDVSTAATVALVRVPAGVWGGGTARPPRGS